MKLHVSRSSFAARACACTACYWLSFARPLAAAVTLRRTFEARTRTTTCGNSLTGTLSVSPSLFLFLTSRHLFASACVERDLGGSFMQRCEDSCHE